MPFLTRERYALARSFRHQGFGWEDICVRLQLTSTLDRETIRDLVLGHAAPERGGHSVGSGAVSMGMQPRPDTVERV